MDDGRASPKRAGQRKINEGGRRRLTKIDKTSDIAKAADVKSSANIVLPEIKKVLLDQHARNAERTNRRSNTIFPSEMARSEWCPRATYYRMSGLPDPSSSYSFGLDNVFSEGNAIHAKWQRWLAETGHLWGDWYCEPCGTRVNNSVLPEPIQFEGHTPYWTSDHHHDWEYKEVTLKSTEHRISGHADGALINHNCLIEIKSMGIGTFRFEAPKLLEQHTYKIGTKKVTDVEGMWNDLHRPLISHVKQGNIYLYMAQEQNMPFDSIVFLYEFKANQKVKEFRIKRSDDILAPLLDTAAQIEYALSVGVPPACPFGGCGSCKAYEGTPAEEKKSHYEEEK